MTLKEFYKEHEDRLELMLNHPSYKEGDGHISRMVDRVMEQLEKIEKGAQKHGWNANRLFVKVD